MKVVPILSYDEARDVGAAVHDHWLRMNGAAPIARPSRPGRSRPVRFKDLRPKFGVLSIREYEHEGRAKYAAFVDAIRPTGVFRVPGQRRWRAATIASALITPRLKSIVPSGVVTTT